MMKLTWLDPHAPELALSRSPGSTSRPLKADLNDLLTAGIQHVICLQQAHEFEHMDDSLEQRQATLHSLGIRFTHSPIEDLAAPTLIQAQQLVELIQRELLAKRKLLLHCQAGLGRAGTIAACLLITQGLSPHGAISMIRWYRPGAIQSQAQETLIEAFHAAHPIKHQ